MNQAGLSELFGGRERFEVLRALYLNPAKWFSNRQLAQLAGVNAGNAHRLLNRWAELGLVRKQAEGRNIAYQASDDPLLIGLQDIVVRNDQLVQDIARALPKSVDTAVVFGSRARGEEHAESDIDVLALGPELSEIKLNAALRAVGRKHHRAIHVCVYSQDEFEAMVRAGNSFALSVIEQRVIPLKGRFAYAA